MGGAYYVNASMVLGAWSGGGGGGGRCYLGLVYYIREGNSELTNCWCWSFDHMRQS